MRNGRSGGYPDVPKAKLPCWPCVVVVLSIGVAVGEFLIRSF